MTRSHSSADIEKIIRSRSTPALLTRMSSRPYCSSAVATSFSPVAHSAISPAATTAWPSAAVISPATACTASPGRSFSTSRAPARASASDSARPSPFPAPVTMATRPVSVSASSIPPRISFQDLYAERSWFPPWLPGPWPPGSVARAGQDAAVGDELAAGGVGRLVGSQVRHQPRDLDRLGEPGQRHGLDEGLAVVGSACAGRVDDHPGQDPARMHRVDPDAELGQLTRGHLGHAADRELACAVGRKPGRAGEPLDRGDVN